MARNGRAIPDLAQRPSRSDITESYMSRMKELGCTERSDGTPSIFFLKT